MFQEHDNDDLYTPNAIQSESTTTTNDPQLKYIYDFLTDPTKTTYDPPSNVSDGNHFNYLQSPTVNPVGRFPTSNEFHQEIEDQYRQTNISKPIVILTQPRKKFRPRTEKESQDSSHYIRTEDSIQPNYPSIEIDPCWEKDKTIIEVSLMNINKQPHRYMLENKERHKSRLIFKENEVNTLYFHITEEDCQQRQKIFLIEYVKLKQDKLITKELIKSEKLDQSMLRFTRYYQLSDGSYQQDEASTTYSSIMTEDYGEFSVEDIFPHYGPMNSSEKICIELKGILPKNLSDHFQLDLVNDQFKWIYPINTFKKKGSNLIAVIPPCPFPQMNRVNIKLRIQYQQQNIYETNYLYTHKIDEELNPSNSSMNGFDVRTTTNKRLRQE